MEEVFVEGRKFKWGFHSEEEWLMSKSVLNGPINLLLLIQARNKQQIVLQSALVAPILLMAMVLKNAFVKQMIQV